MKKDKGFSEAIRLFARAIAMQTEGQSGKSSCLEQKAKLAAAMGEFERRMDREETSPHASPVDAQPAVASAVAKSAEPRSTAQQFRPTVASGPITIDADILRERPIKSVEINCKIEYS